MVMIKMLSAKTRDGYGDVGDDECTHLMIGVSPLLHQQIVDCLIAEASRPSKGVFSQVGQALLLVINIMKIIIVIAILIYHIHLYRMKLSLHYVSPL